MSTNQESFEIADESALARFAETFVGMLHPGILIGLCGPLGSGKTTFVRYAVTALNRSATKPAVYVHSPTFSLVHEYPGNPPSVHLDLYRLPGEGQALAEQLENLGLRDYLDQKRLLWVEWIDRLGGKFWTADIEIWFHQKEKATERTLEFRVPNPGVLDLRALLAAWSGRKKP